MTKKTIPLTFDELSAIKHNDNLNAMESFIRYAEKTGILQSAPWEAVLMTFVEWKNEAERLATEQSQSDYIDRINEAIDEFHTMKSISNN